MVHYFLYCRKPVKCMAGMTLFLSQMAALNGFILLKKFTKTKKATSLNSGAPNLTVFRR